jgi:LysM repeat protein
LWGVLLVSWAGNITDTPTPTLAAIPTPTPSITVNLLAGTAIAGKTLGLTKTASPLTYDRAGLTITYSYVITNTGSLPIGPAQFMIQDDHFSAPFPCGTDPATTLNPGLTVSCQNTYTTTPQDMGVSSVTNTAIASGGDAQASAPVSTTITNSTFVPSVTPAPLNLTPGATIRHQVVKGEWLFQIARCYGVEYKSLRNANSQIPNPSVIDPGLVVTVPNIGSAGKIYGPPCVVYHTVVAGDTWNSLATHYNARLDVLQQVNPAGLVVGAQIKVPINSAGGTAVQVPVTGVATSTSTLTPTPTATATVTSTSVLAIFPATPTITSMVINTPTVTPTGGSALLGAVQATPITIPAGSTSTSVSGALVSRATVSYLLAASQGQTMTVSLAANANDIAMRIHQPNGLPAVGWILT